MSFFDDASLVFLPSGQAGKDGKAYSMKPVPEYGSELLSDTNQFDTTWITTNASVTGGQSGYDGSSDAWLLEATNTASILYQIVSSSGVQNISVYAKAGTTDNLVFYSLTSPSVRAGFDLTNGSVNYELRSIDASIEDVGNGWYRCSMVFSGASTAVRIYPADSSLTATIGDNIYIQDASLKEITTQAADFTFSRGSNLTATRVDSNGLIEKGRENLLLQSNQFDNATWIGRSQTTLTGGQIGYDGSNDSWSCATTSGQIMGQSKVNQGVQTISVYAKGSVSNGLRIFAFGNDNVDFWFNLNTGLPDGSISSKVIDYNIEDVNGDGEWYRCSFTFSQTTSSIYFYCTDNNKSNASGTIYLQDAQLEQGLVATEYIESGATTGLAGILEDSPRFDYSGGASCPSLLLEPSRTNLVTHSEYMLGSNWVGSFTTITPILSNTLSPQGVANCYQITRSGSNIQLGSVVSITSGNTYTGSIYVRKVSGSDTAILKDVNNSSTSIDITTEWKRFHTTATATSGNGRLYIQPQSDGDVIEVYGAQLEQGSYPTSYIPNHSGGSVTREADSFQNDTNTSPLNRNAEGTWFVELQKLGDDTNQALYLAPMTSNTQQIRLHFDASNARFRDAVNGYATIGGGVDVKTSMTKMALSIDTTSGIAKVYANGSQLGSDYTLQSNPFEFSRIVAEGKGFILKQSLFFPTALSDVELTALTS